MSKPSANLLQRLADAGVDFVLVGGFAGIVHGCTYTTQDIDICCDFSPANLFRLQQAVADLHPVHRMTPTRKQFELSEGTIGQLKNLYLDTDIGQLDCLSFIDGLGDYPQVRQASESVTIPDARLQVLSLDALIRAKEAMNRPRDREAIVQLDAIRKFRKKTDGHS